MFIFLAINFFYLLKNYKRLLYYNIKIEPNAVQVGKLISKCTTKQFARYENSDTNL